MPIPTKSTHVVIQPSDLFEQAEGDGIAIETLKPGTVVTLIESENGWTLVAKDGKKLGYVAAQELIPIQ